MQASRPQDNVRRFENACGFASTKASAMVLSPVVGKERAKIIKSARMPQ